MTLFSHIICEAAPLRVWNKYKIYQNVHFYGINMFSFVLIVQELEYYSGMAGLELPVDFLCLIFPIMRLVKPYHSVMTKRITLDLFQFGHYLIVYFFVTCVAWQALRDYFFCPSFCHTFFITLSNNFFYSKDWIETKDKRF